MRDASNLLSQEEIDALATGIMGGNIPVDTGYNSAARVRKHDLTNEDSSLGDFIEDRGATNPSHAVISMNLSEQTRKVLATLTPREEKVLRMRFGIGEKSDHTLEEVGQDFEVTRERIRQIEAKALRKLRHPSRAKKLQAFVDASGGQIA